MGYTGQKKKDYQLKWIKARRKKYLDQMGPCFFCGSSENIEFHHIDPTKKESHKIWSWSDDRIQAELKQCIPLCNKCHIKFHSILKQKPLLHGTLHAYQKYKCRCKYCRLAKKLHTAFYEEFGSTDSIQVGEAVLNEVNQEK